MAARVKESEHGDILDVVYKSAKKGTLLASCEPEVKELMRQIELFLANKKTESDAELHSCKTQLHQRDRELSSLRVSMQERQQQIDKLKGDLSNAEHLRKVNNSNHETQLLRLRSELNRLKKNYEKLKARRGFVDKDSDLEEELKSVKSIQESQYGELLTVKAHNGALQEELARCRNIIEHKEIDGQSQAEQLVLLQRQLTQHQEQAKSNDVEYSLLKSDYDKTRRCLEEDVQRLREKIEFLSRQNKELQCNEADMSLNVAKLQASLQTSESERLRLSRQVAALRDVIEKKESSLKQQYEQATTAAVDKKQQQINEMLGELEKRSVTEKSLQDENARLRRRLEQAKADKASNARDAALQQCRSELMSKNQLVTTLQDTVAHLQDQLSDATTPTGNRVSHNDSYSQATPTITTDHRVELFQAKLEKLIEQHFKKIDESLKNALT